MSKPEPVQAIVAPSMLSCDLAHLSKETKMVLEMGADWIHMDVMDGAFVPNLSFGPPVIGALRKARKKAFLDCHMMVTDPIKWVKPMADAGANSFTFHIESNMPEGGPAAMIAAIREAGMRVGICLKPGTPVWDVYDYVDDVDLVLIMTVEPGFSGQKFMASMMPKVKSLRERYPNLNIEVDGGLSPKTVDEATEAGANVIVAASAIFGSDDRKAVIDNLRESVLKNVVVTGEEAKKKE